MISGNNTHRHSKNGLVIIGKITGHHGIKGWVKIQSFTRPADQIFEYRQIMLGTGDTMKSFRQADVLNYRHQGKGIIAQIEGFNSREDSEFITGCSMAINQDQLEVLSEGEYYWMDIIGSRVLNAAHKDFGTVDSMMETGANDVMVVISDVASGDESGDESIERLIPWIDDVIESFDPSAKVVRVNWDEDF
jgi:16S rRNA processing protein RimM